MKEYILQFQNKNDEEKLFNNNRAALIYARQYNADKNNTDKISNIWVGYYNSVSILDIKIVNNIKRISEYLTSKGFKLKRKKSVYVVESDSIKLFDIVQELKTMVNEDLNGHILWGNLCLDAQKNKYLYRVIFD